MVSEVAAPSACGSPGEGHLQRFGARQLNGKTCIVRVPHVLTCIVGVPHVFCTGRPDACRPACLYSPWSTKSPLKYSCSYSDVVASLFCRNTYCLSLTQTCL